MKISNFTRLFAVLMLLVVTASVAVPEAEARFRIPRVKVKLPRRVVTAAAIAAARAARPPRVTVGVNNADIYSARQNDKTEFFVMTGEQALLNRNEVLENIYVQSLEFIKAVKVAGAGMGVTYLTEAQAVVNVFKCR